MAGSWKLSVFAFILCAGNVILTAQGLKFAKNKYVIVLTAGCKKGIIGKINMDEKSSGMSYSMEGENGLLHIDKYSGKIELMKTLDSTSLDKKEVTIKASDRVTGQKANAKVVIVLLPLHYGDQFIDKVGRMEVSSEHAERLKTSPFSLLHILRRATATANEIGMAELKWELKIMKIKNMILNEIAKEHGGSVGIQAYLHLRELFSEKGMMKIEEESSCHERNNVRTCDKSRRFRTFDGTCNNLNKPTRGAANTEFKRLLPAQYFDADNLNDPIGYPNQPGAPIVPSPHVVSRNFIIDEIASTSSSSKFTHIMMQFGQLLDHDLDLAVEVEARVRECEQVPCDNPEKDFVCPCYPIVPVEGVTDQCIRVTRSAAVCRKDGYPKQREQINVNTAYIDASQVYGSSEELACRLKDPDNNALLKSSLGRDGAELLPLDTEMREGPLGLCEDLGGCFLAGDTRSNEQTALAAIHTLFLREHNRIARFLQKLNGCHWTDSKVFLETRRILAAVMQKITYKDFLPKIVGPNGLKPHNGYSEDVDPSISNAFATAAFRFGHSLIRSRFDRLNKNFDPVGEPIDLRFMFFNNTIIQKEGISPLLLGLVGNFSENVDRILSRGLIKSLFERENRRGLNLAALNVQRSRDHGLPGYNEYREFFDLGEANTFEETKNEIRNSENRKILERTYRTPKNVELWVAGLAETPLPGASVGALFSGLISEQFERSRDGDRFYYEANGVFRQHRRAEIPNASLSRMYCDNLRDVVSIQPDAFLAPTDETPRVTCARIPGIDLCQWKETRYFTKPCTFGKLTEKGGKCICKCTKGSFGPKCDARCMTRPARWHASIADRRGRVYCYGARIGRYHVLTTTACANRVRFLKPRIRLVGRSGTLRSGHTFFVTRSSKNGLLTLLRMSTGFYHRPTAAEIIKIGLGESTTEVRDVTFLGAWSRLYAVQVHAAKETLCREVFKRFDPRKNACTLPAALPATRRREGSPLVEYVGNKPFLRGLLTDIKSDEEVPGDRFGKYITITSGAVTRWIKKYIPKIQFNVFA